MNFFPLEHLRELLLKRDGGSLFVVGTGSDAHGKGDAFPVHEQPHLHDGGGAVFFGRPIFAQAPGGFPGHFIHIIVIFRFCFKIIVAAVIEADGSVPLYDVSALFKQVGDVSVIMFLHDVHGPHDMHVIKPGLFVKVCQVPVCTEFGIRMEDTGTGKEPV